MRSARPTGRGRLDPRRRVRGTGAAVLLAGLVFAARASAQDESAKRLTWPSVTVQAHLEADGRLLVRERQVLRFTGDWNGGERRFTPRFGQTITLRGMTREDSGGGARPLREGDLSAVDEYKWVSSHSLRWRARRPEDPPFAGDVRAYTLDLAYDNVLLRRAGTWVLDHDFAFADRAEPIDTFRLSLTLDPAWQFVESPPGEIVVAPLAAGDNYVLTVPLRHVGDAPLGSVFTGAPAPARFVLLGVLWGGIAWVLVWWIGRERRSGRWSPEPLPPVTPKWFRSWVLSMPPEVAGAAWDDQTGAAEVAAVLARLVSEGKLATTVRDEKAWIFKWQVLELRLLVDRTAFQRYDRALVDALFDAGATTTDTNRVRQRYAKSGFNPASIISEGISRSIAKLAPPLRGEARGGWKPTAALVAGAAAALAAGIMQRGWDATFMAVTLAVLVVTQMVGLGVSLSFRQSVLTPAWGVPPLLAVALLPAALLSWQLVAPFTPFGALTQLGAVLLAVAHVRSLLRRAVPTMSPERMALRRRLAHARAWCKAQLASRTPELEDAWYPWLIAFGLGKAVERWFAAFGGTASAVSRSGGLGSSSGGSSSASGGGWTGFGGGGGFSGGGSAASFATAVGGMAAAVPKPSSSGGSSGGGGGSSGGGGGGGW